VTGDPSRDLAVEYSKKAAEYARHWAPVIAPMALPVLEQLPFGTGRTVLDIGTGTGAMLPHIRRLAPDARLVGVDLAEGMLRIAQQYGRAALVVGDAQRLPVASACVDVALLVFALFHMPDPAAALREAHRVLRDGGVLGAVTWGHDPGLPAIAIWKEELDREEAAPDPRSPHVMNQGMMNTAAKLRGLICDSGLIPTKLWTAGVQHEWVPAELLATQAGCGMPARRLSSLAPDRRAACEARVRARVLTLTSAELTYTSEVLFAIARRP
jgi:ubiquinone/menaquinone biosynthesis C-methylase UbiE